MEPPPYAEIGTRQKNKGCWINTYNIAASVAYVSKLWRDIGVEVIDVYHTLNARNEDSDDAIHYLRTLRYLRKTRL